MHHPRDSVTGLRHRPYDRTEGPATHPHQHLHPYPLPPPRYPCVGKPIDTDTSHPRWQHGVAARPAPSKLPKILPDTSCDRANMTATDTHRVLRTKSTKSSPRYDGSAGCRKSTQRPRCALHVPITLGAIHIVLRELIPHCDGLCRLRTCQTSWASVQVSPGPGSQHRMLPTGQKW